MRLHAAIILVLASAALANDRNMPSEIEINKFQERIRAFSAAIFVKAMEDYDDSENMIFSPASIAHTAGMVLSGTKEITSWELKRVLRVDFRKTNQELDNLFKETFMGRFTPRENRGPVTLMATKAFLQEGFDMYDNYTQILHDYYLADVDGIDFSEREEAASIINTWVEDQTNQLIRELVSPNMFSALTRFALVNALYFKGSWKKPFSEIGSKVFQAPSGNVSAPYMKVKTLMKFRETIDMVYVGIPYNDAKHYMIVIMPKTDRVMKRFAQRTYMETYFRNFDSKFKAWDFRNIILYFPKFEIEQRMDVKEELKKMYVFDLFDSTYADLSGMSKEFLYVTDFVHKAKITVTKEGTEAAAATAAIGSSRSLGIRIAMEVTIDKPFIFGIYEAGDLLFMGRVADPSIK